MQPHDKILILTSVGPDNSNSSGRFIQQLLKHLEPECTAIALITGEDKALHCEFETLKLPLPAAPTINHSGVSISRAEETIYWLFRQRFFKKLDALIIDLEAFAERNRVSHIIAVLDHPATIWLTKKLAMSLSVPYTTFTSVLPETVLYFAGYDSRSKSQVFKEYIEVLKTAQANGFSSQPMARQFQEKFSVKVTEISIPANSVESTEFTASDPDSNSPLRIGCVLNPRFMQSTQSLITACQDICWKVDNKSIVLRLIGSAAGVPFRFAGKPAEIEILGGLSEKASVQALSECAFNFLPYWTEPQFAQATRLCLPDDFPTYLAASRPILVQTLKSSFVEDTMRDFSLGKALESLSENLFIPAVRSLLEAGQGEEIRHFVHKLRQERFSESAFQASICALLPSSYIEKNSTA